MTEIAILSGKGGTGKTSLSAAFATINNELVVADCDVDAANLHLILQPDNYHEEKFITGYKAIINSDTCNNCGLCIKYCRFDAIAYKNEHVTIRIYDIMGREVKLLTSRIYSAGLHSINFEASGFSSGLYLYKLSAGEFSYTKKMVLIK